jgi:hypothetical protein
VTLRAPLGQRVGVAIDGVLRAELRDGAEVAYTPTRLEIVEGYVRLVADRRLPVRAASQELTVNPGTDVALELRDPREGERSMRPHWLIPTSAASGAVLTLAVLVATGQVALHQAAADTPAPPGKVLVLHPEAAAPPPRRVAELEQKVSALRQENGRLAGQLVQKKGVTLDQLRERITTLSRTPLGGLLAPGAMTDLLTDLKGMGPAGVEAMIKLLRSEVPNERFLAAKLLEDQSPPAAIDGLKQMALGDKTEMNANMASHALALMDDSAAVPALRAIADAGPSWGAQVNALWGLCKHGDKQAIDQALAWMKDTTKTPQMRAVLGANLMVLPDPELMPIVDQTLKDFGSEESVATMATTYYKGVGTPEGRDRLEAMAANEKLAASVRKAAREALTGK